MSDSGASNRGARVPTGIAFGAAVALLIVGTVVALNQWHLRQGQAVAVLCLISGVLLLLGATFFWLVTGPDRTATVVAEGQVVLGTGAGFVLVLWGQAFIALAFIAAWRLLYPPKPPKHGGQALPGAGMPGLSDVVQLIQALTVAPTWLGMTVVGVVLTFVGAWVIRSSRTETP